MNYKNYLRKYPHTKGRHRHTWKRVLLCENGMVKAAMQCRRCGAIL